MTTFPLREISLLLLAAISVAAQDGAVLISGEISRNQEFRKEIGGALVLVLSPDEDNGWTISVEPKENPNDPACDDYVAVATPPYHGPNARFINTAYGIQAKDAMKQSRREFAFVTNCADNRREEGWVERIVNPGGYSEQEVKEGYAKLGTSPMGKGVLTILDSKTSPAKETVEGVNLGQIDWIKFEATITLPEERPKRRAK
jgi:hypothetical protein